MNPQTAITESSFMQGQGTNTRVQGDPASLFSASQGKMSNLLQFAENIRWQNQFHTGIGYS
jgi:hypothetical protein